MTCEIEWKVQGFQSKVCDVHDPILGQASLLRSMEYNVDIGPRGCLLKTRFKFKIGLIFKANDEKVTPELTNSDPIKNVHVVVYNYGSIGMEAISPIQIFRGQVDIYISDIKLKSSYFYEDSLLTYKAEIPIGNDPEAYKFLKKNNEFIITAIFHHGYDTSSFIKEDISRTFNEGLQHTDVTLISSSGDKIPCHKFMLAARSPVFKAMFSLKLSKENTTGRIEIVDFSTKALEAMVKYIYTEEIEEKDTSIALELLALSDKYDLAKSRFMLSKKLVELVDVENCLRYYVYGFLHNADELKRAALDVLYKNWQTIKKNHEKDLVQLAIEYPKASIEIMQHWQRMLTQYETCDRLELSFT